MDDHLAGTGQGDAGLAAAQDDLAFGAELQAFAVQPGGRFLRQALDTPDHQWLARVAGDEQQRHLGADIGAAELRGGGGGQAVLAGAAGVGDHRRGGVRYVEEDADDHAVEAGGEGRRGPG